jgi:hypothetical protein
MLCEPDLALSCAAELCVALVEQPSDTAIQRIVLCIREPVCAILKCCPLTIERILICDSLSWWEAAVNPDAAHESSISDLRLSNCAACVSDCLEPFASDLDDKLSTEKGKFICSIQVLLKLHSAVASVMEKKDWLRIHGKWLVHSKRCDCIPLSVHVFTS